MGDFNAQIIGYGSNERTNRNDERIIRLCEEFNLSIINNEEYDTFNHRAGFNATCIDYVLCDWRT